MPRWSDFLPPILTRAFAADASDRSRKELSGSIDFLPGLSAFLNPDEPLYRTAHSYEKRASEGYGANVVLYRGVSLIAQSIAGIPVTLSKQGRGGKATEVDSHPLLDLLNREANDEDSGPELLEALVGYWLLAGHTYLWAVRPQTGQRAPTKLFAVQPNLMRPDVARDGTLLGWVYQVGGQKQEFAAEDVLRIKDFHPSSRVSGMAPAQVAARAIDQHNSANDWNTAVMQNMARPSGMITPKENVIIPPDAHERFTADLREKYQGPRNAGKPLVPRAPMVWQAMGQTATEMDWLNGKVQAAREIAIALGVPPELLGDHANATWSNFMEARRSYYTETVLPRMDRLYAALGRFLLPMYGLDPIQYTLSYDKDAIEALQEDRDAQHARARADYAGGLLTLNEAREAIGQDAAAEGDFYLAPPRAMTVDQLLEGAGLPSMRVDGAVAHPPAVPPPGGAPHPALPTPPGVPALPAGQIVDSQPPNSAAGNSAAAAGPGGKALRDPKAKAAAPGEAASGGGGDALPPALAQRLAQRTAAHRALTRQVADQFAADAAALQAILTEAERSGTDPQEAVRRVVAAAQARREDWRALLAAALLAIGATAGTRLYQEFAQAAGLTGATAAPGYDPQRGALADALADDVAGQRAAALTQTTAGALAADLADALATVGTVAALTATVADTYAAWRDWRAEAIAGDWTVYADGVGSDDGADQFAADAPGGVSVQRTWVTMGDARVRPAHADADGQTVGLHEPFTVGGESLMCPGDFGAPASLTDGCRCTIDYSIA